MTKNDKPILTKDGKPVSSPLVTKDGKPVNVPWSLLIGIGGLILGLGSQLWGIAMVGAIFLGYWLLKRYPPRTLAVQAVPETPTAPQPTPVVEHPDSRSDNTVVSLKELAGLHERGALTDEEFAAAKARLLG